MVSGTVSVVVSVLETPAPRLPSARVPSARSPASSTSSVERKKLSVNGPEAAVPMLAMVCCTASVPPACTVAGVVNAVMSRSGAAAEPTVNGLEACVLLFSFSSGTAASSSTTARIRQAPDAVPAGTVIVRSSVALPPTASVGTLREPSSTSPAARSVPAAR